MWWPAPASTAAPTPSWPIRSKKFGISVNFVEDRTTWRSGATPCSPTPSCSFGEVVSNPRQDVLDIEGISQVAHEAGVPLTWDGTLSTPYLIRPIEWGADIVVHSATKYLGGHGAAIAGVIVDSGNFDFRVAPKRFPGFNTPDPTYNGLVYARDLGKDGALGANLSYILKARVQLLGDLGSAVSPFNAFLIAQGIETLSLRVERHVANATKVAEWLEARDNVGIGRRTPGCPPAPGTERGRQYGPRGAGADRRLRPRRRQRRPARRFVDALELHSHVANLGDVRSLVVHPASTTHTQLTEAEQQAAAGVTPGPGPPRRRPRAHRRHPRRPRGRLPGGQGRLGREGAAVTRASQSSPQAPPLFRKLSDRS